MRSVSLANYRKLSLNFPETSNDLTLDSLISEIYTDFNKTRPLVLEHNTQIDEALKMMKVAHVKLKLVIDKDGQLIGLVTYNDLIGERPMVIETRHRINRNEIDVSDVMTSLSEIVAISIQSLNESIRNLIELMKAERTRYILVLNESEEKITGIISSSDIIRKLKLPLSLGIYDDSSFTRIFNVMN